MRKPKGLSGFRFFGFAVWAVVSVAAGIMWPEGWLYVGMSIVLLVASAVGQSDLGKAKILSIVRENVFVILSNRAQGYKLIIFCQSMAALMIDTLPSVAAGQAAAQLIPQKQNESWAAVVGIAVAIVGVAVAIVSTSWLSRNRVSLDLEEHQALDPHEEEAILDISQAFLNSQLRINARSFEDHLLPMIAE